MPIYEYRCHSCGHELEKLQRLSDETLRDCPACGQPELRRLISAAGFRLKGAGWYETDFKKDGRKNLHESGEKAGSASTDEKSGKSTKSDSGAGESTKPASDKVSDSKQTEGKKTEGKKTESKPAAGGSTAA